VLAKLEPLMPGNVKDDYLKIKKRIDIELDSKNEDLKRSPMFSLLKQVLFKVSKIKLKLLSEKSIKIVENVFPEKLLYRDGEWFLIATIEGKKKTIPINQIKGLIF
jgi:hypothetical protein